MTSKHMDKHRRPYVCKEPGCEKIPGFTYSGGLLRHEREVHKRHGGPKAMCMCPHQDCKRSTGIGFSRKENLLEHLRRVHRNVDTRIQDPNVGQHANQGPEEQRKRRRVVDDDDFNAIKSEETKDLREQFKRLRQDGEERDRRLQRLETKVEKLTEILTNVQSRPS